MTYNTQLYFRSFALLFFCCTFVLIRRSFSMYLFEWKDDEIGCICFSYSNVPQIKRWHWQGFTMRSTFLCFCILSSVSVGFHFLKIHFMFNTVRRMLLYPVGNLVIRWLNFYCSINVIHSLFIFHHISKHAIPSFKLYLSPSQCSTYSTVFNALSKSKSMNIEYCSIKKKSKRSH